MRNLYCGDDKISAYLLTSAVMTGSNPVSPKARRAGVPRRYQQALTLLFCLAVPAAVLGSDGGASVIALEGYSVVSYFDPGRAERGSPEHSVSHDGQVYFFTSDAQRRAFESEPEAYLPRFNASCPYSLILGRDVAIDPTRFKVIGGRLLLFHNSSELDALEAWENDERSDQELLDQASKRFELLRF